MNTLITIFTINKPKLESDRNKRKIEQLAKRLPKAILQRGVASFTTNFVASKIIKSKKKLMKKTKSK